MKAQEGAIELKKIDSAKVSGYDSAAYSAGFSQYWVSSKLRSRQSKQARLVSVEVSHQVKKLQLLNILKPSLDNRGKSLNGYFKKWESD